MSIVKEKVKKQSSVASKNTNLEKKISPMMLEEY